MINYKKYIAECPIKYLKDLIDEYGFDELKNICIDSEWYDINVRNGDNDCHNGGYVSNITYIYSERLNSYCLQFKCQLYDRVNPERFESFELRLSINKILRLTIIENI